METCIACGMPLVNKEDFGTNTSDGSVCIHCSNEDGSIKSCETIFEGGVQFFLSSIPDMDRSFAERIVRKNMNRLVYWEKNKTGCLEGEEASDEEFQMVLSKL
jgi:hypothetical protein